MECDKRSYEIPKDASEDLIGLRQRNKKHKFSIYKCPQCPYYHITTVTKKILRPVKKDKYPIEIYSRPEPESKNKSKKKKK
jgi:hypothetical protein